MAENCGNCKRGDKPRVLEPKCQKCFDKACQPGGDQFSEWEAKSDKPD